MQAGLLLLIRTTLNDKSGNLVRHSPEDGHVSNGKSAGSGRKDRQNTNNSTIVPDRHDDNRARVQTGSRELFHARIGLCIITAQCGVVSYAEAGERQLQLYRDANIGSGRAAASAAAYLAGGFIHRGNGRAMRAGEYLRALNKHIQFASQ